MIQRIKKYRKWKEYYDITAIEVKVALFFTIIIVGVLYFKINLYEIFNDISPKIEALLTCLIGGELSFLGMTLAGLAIIVSLFDVETINIIKKIDTEDTINKVITSFEFLAFNITFQICYWILIYLCIISTAQITDKVIFYIIFIIVIYHTIFNLMYMVSLIGNCIELNSIKLNCNKIKKINKSVIDMANEVRIDYLIGILSKERRLNKETLVQDLDLILGRIPSEEREMIRKYLYNYYDIIEK